ncbi:MAG: 2-amino-4-hydroxy-6-hydroxymethyldihydropteridine diphosphokinase [Cellvibrionales bacterium]|nr:2-amino-4-hydroxy-6-hydroxymethyldihydropteridine diphosphokinase [Cellvibrionales bacterium]
MRHQVFLGLGSNTNKQTNIPKCMQLLVDTFDQVDFSPVYESQSVGIQSENFYNLVARVATTWSLEKLLTFIQVTESRYGRRRHPELSDTIPLDIDILLYDDFVGEFQQLVLPRPEILTNAFVLKPLAELAGDLVHPQCGRRICALWQEYPKAKQPLWQVSLSELKEACMR